MTWLETCTDSTQTVLPVSGHVHALRTIVVMKKTLCRHLMCLGIPLLLVMAGPAGAVEILVNPGAVGSSFTNTSISFNDFNGVALQGQNIEIDFVFDSKKHLKPIFNDPGGANFFYIVSLIFLVNTPGSPGIGPTPTGFLSDENGVSIAPALSFGVFQDPGLFGYTLSFGEDVVDGLIHHDIHFDVFLPNNPAVQITNGDLDLGITSPSGVIEVGAWKVPEPGTLAVFAVGLAGLGFMGWRRRKGS